MAAYIIKERWRSRISGVIDKETERIIMAAARIPQEEIRETDNTKG